MNNYPILAPQNTWWKPNVSSVTRAIITEIELKDSYTPDSSMTVVDSWDASAAQDGSITCYVIGTKLIIAGNGSGKIAANEDSAQVFAKFTVLNIFSGENLLDTSNVINLYGCFFMCEALTSIDVSTWDVSNVTNLGGLFARCYKLKSIQGINNWDTSNATNMSMIFVYTNSLSSINLSNWDTSNVTDLGMLFYKSEGIVQVEGMSAWDVSNVYAFNALFGDCINLTHIDSLENWDVSNGEHFNAMFNNCSKLTSVGDLTNWNTAKLINASGMFNGCTNLVSIGNLSNWDVSKATNLSVMFEYCSKLTGIGSLANWNPSSCTNISFMFYGCSSLKEIDVSNWDVSKVENFDHFAAHANLRRKGIENWKTTSATNMNALFHNCAEEELDLSGWDVSKVQFFCQMFENSPNLKHIKGLEKWDTSSGVGFDEMFGRCYKLEELDLSSWNTSKAKNGVKASINGHTTGTFRNFCNDCRNLKWIKLGPNFAVNGDGTNTNAEYKLILPVPAVEGADGLWRTFTNKTFEPNAIPDRTANTYYASKNLIRNLNLRINNGTILDIVEAVRERVPDLEPTLLSDLDDIIRNI